MAGVVPDGSPADVRPVDDDNPGVGGAADEASGVLCFRGVGDAGSVGGADVAVVEVVMGQDLRELLQSAADLLPDR